MRFAEKSVARRFTKKVDSHGSVNSMCRVDSWSRFMETIHGKVRVANLSTARRRFILENTTAQLVDDSSPKTPRHSSSTIHSQKHHGAARRRFILKNSMVQHVLRDDSHSIHSIHSGVELWSRFKSTFKLWKQVSGRFMKTPKVDSRSRFMPK